LPSPALEIYFSLSNTETGGPGSRERFVSY
jgi:hypothetical protein